MMNKTYTTHVLDNGLMVLLKEDHSAPIISQWLWYRTGSRNEKPGKTGISHCVEHLQFKGTERFPGREITQSISRSGGIWGAFTLQDCTAYYETMPADRISIAMEIEADRMSNSIYDPKEVESERNVILSEWEGIENHTAYYLEKSVLRAAYPNHPYGMDIIGAPDDIRNLTRNDLYEYYRTWYSPNNAVVVAAGDFDKTKMLRLVENYYGNIPARTIPTYVIPPEEPIRGRKYVRVHGKSDMTLLEIAWQIPGTADPANPALTLLKGILIGPDLMEYYDQVDHTVRTSRLSQKLINKRFAFDVHGGFEHTIDPFIFKFCVSVNPDFKTEDVAEVIFEELEGIARNGIHPSEIDKARKQAIAAMAYASEDVTNQAYWLGWSSIFADPTWFSNYALRLEKVTSEDISRAAETFFRRDNCIIGIYSQEEEKQ